MSNELILTINSGSSSIKASLYSFAKAEQLHASCKITKIGLKKGFFYVKDGKGTTIQEKEESYPNHSIAFHALFDWLAARKFEGEIVAVGHRIVCSGPKYSFPIQVSLDVLDDLKKMIPLDPLHMPSEIEGCEIVWQHFPDMLQVACFDTHFHRTIPAHVKEFPLPKNVQQLGIQRYGFHGLSYEYIMEELGEEAKKQNIVIAHLGSGSSLAAVKNGACIDTTMGLTPLGGVMMGTRTGDIDPGVVLYLLQEKGISADEVSRIIYQESGLKGISGTSPDVRDLLLAEEKDQQAKLALKMYCYQVSKCIGALATALGGVDSLIFTAGIGENSPKIRERILSPLSILGIEFDSARNQSNQTIFSSNSTRTKVMTLKTNEEIMIARHTYRTHALTRAK